MAWKAYRIVLRLRSPVHIGAGKVGNLQRTRTYITGRNLWGALTSRLTREEDPHGKPEPGLYEQMGERVHQQLAFTYFFPTTDQQGCAALYPRLDPRGKEGYGQNGSGESRMDAATFRYRFLSTYPGTALDPTTNSAQEASLHEVECLLPYTRGLGAPVFLTGYIFQKENDDLDWQAALDQLQIGGERGYGWGQVAIVEIAEQQRAPLPLFDSGHTAHLDGKNVRIHLQEKQPILAHTLAADFDRKSQAVLAGSIHGPVEPLVGRETRTNSRFGVNLSAARICHPPGARVETGFSVQIGRFGIWESG